MSDANDALLLIALGVALGLVGAWLWRFYSEWLPWIAARRKGGPSADPAEGPPPGSVDGP